MGDHKINLNDLFSSLQDQMLAKLSTNRTFIKHSGSKGDALENVWIEWLRNYLPNRYSIDKAIVVDSEGSTSDQIDLVIYDQQYTPFVFSQDGMKYIPVEGVYAVFEVKPDIKGSVKDSEEGYISYIKYAGKKIESVRNLVRTSASIVDRGEVKKGRSLTKIVGGILASNNGYSGEETIKGHLKALSGNQSIDMGCVVDQGSFYVDYGEKEDESISDLTERISSYYLNRQVKDIVFSYPSQSLIGFFLQLSRYLQQGIGTIAAIDFSSYASSAGIMIDEEI